MFSGLPHEDEEGRRPWGETVHQQDSETGASVTSTEKTNAWDGKPQGRLLARWATGAGPRGVGDRLQQAATPQAERTQRELRGSSGRGPDSQTTWETNALNVESQTWTALVSQGPCESQPL